MQYFMPAWHADGSWMENEQAWYRSRKVTEFDDTVKQVQLFFRRHVAPFEICLLDFSPNFRHFLHRQGVLHAPWWSCFDAMQGIGARSMQTFSFHDLTWPEGTEFVYSPFAVIALVEGRKYAQIEFGEDGNMFRVDLFRGDVLVSRNLYDDRGFVSCQISYQDGAAVRERYFAEDGTWKLARYLDDGHVVINHRSAWFLHGEGKTAVRVPYRQERYGSMDELISEVLQDFLADTSSSDAFVIAMDSWHSKVLSEVLEGRRTILSFFGRRNGGRGISEAGRKLLAGASSIVADTRSDAREIEELAGGIAAPIHVITPYEARVEVGMSLHLHVQNILLAVDALDADVLDAVAVELAAYVLGKNRQARVCLFTRSAAFEAPARILQKVQDALAAAGMDPALAQEPAGVAENGPDEGDTPERIFTVVRCVDELHVSRTMREQRVVVDLSEVPDQFLQISAMSMGVPQIAMHPTEYVADGRNGKILSELEDLPAVVDYYLESIEHFNEAQIASYDLGERFSSSELVKAWKEVISCGEHARD
jgi:accessory secretory protein Asp1